MANKIHKRDVEAFKKCAEHMDQIMRRIQEYNPEANLYVAGFEMNLMAGDHLDTRDREERKALIVSSVIVTGCDAGDW
jgi:hypothetical protein